MIRRSTWVMLVVLVLVIAGYFIFRARSSATPTGQTPTVTANSFLITQADGTLQALHLSDQAGHATQMQRDTSGNWVITLPQPGNADPSMAGAFESQVEALRIVSILTNELNPQDAGLSVPTYTIRLTFNGNIQHVLEVGTLTPSSSGYYVRFDSGTIYVIAKDGIDSLANLITSPPYAPTETPTLTIIPTGSTTPETTTPTLETGTPLPVTSTP